MKQTEERRAWLAKTPRVLEYRRLKWLTWLLTAVILVLVGLMRRPELRIPLPDGVSLMFLPPFHAVVNGLVALCLIGALASVLRGKIAAHRAFIMAAMGLSVIFLLGYVAYHFTNYEVLYGDYDKNGIVDPEEAELVGGMRSLYLALLISHIVAAAVSLPLILLTFSAGWTNHFSIHRKLARWTFPIWLFVAVTGPICYLMLRPYY